MESIIPLRRAGKETLLQIKGFLVGVYGARKPYLQVCWRGVKSAWQEIAEEDDRFSGHLPLCNAKCCNAGDIAEEKGEIVKKD